MMQKVSEDKISIIVPFANVEQYFEQCLTSIQNQTYQNFEVIMIYDISKDESLKIAEKFMQIDNRFKLYKCEPSKGIAFIRNIGLKYANGKYLSWIDSDDCVSKTYLENLHNALTKNNADMSVCRYVRSKRRRRLYQKVSDVHSICSAKNLMKAIVSSNKVGGMLWDKLFVTSIAKKVSFNTRFNNSEDLYFCYNYLKHCKKIAVVDKKLYFYRIRKTSLIASSQTSYKKWIKVVKLLNYIIKDADEEQLKNCAECWRAVLCINFYYRGKKVKGKNDRLVKLLKYYIKIGSKQTKNNKFMPFYYKLYIKLGTIL